MKTICTCCILLLIVYFGIKIAANGPFQLIKSTLAKVVSPSAIVRLSADAARAAFVR